MVLECFVLLCRPLRSHLMRQRQININMALVIVTSVPNRFLMIGPLLLSMRDQWYIVMTEKTLFLTANGQRGEIYTIQSQQSRFIYIIRFPFVTVGAAQIINCSPEWLPDISLFTCGDSFIFMDTSRYTSGKQYDQAAVKYFRHGQSWWLTGSVALKGNRSLKSPALHSVRRVAVSLTVNPSCKALSTVYVCACVCSWWDFILSSSGAEIWEPVGEQCCWESFRGAVQDPLGDNRHWEAGDCLDCPKLHFVGPSRKMLSSLVTAPGK